MVLLLSVYAPDFLPDQNKIAEKSSTQKDREDDLYIILPIQLILYMDHLLIPRLLSLFLVVEGLFAILISEMVLVDPKSEINNGTAPLGNIMANKELINQ